MQEDKDRYSSYEMSRERDENNLTPETEYYDQDVYSALGESSMGGSIAQFLRHNGILIIGICLAIIVLFILYQRLPKTPMASNSHQIEAFESRITQLEEKLSAGDQSMTDLTPATQPSEQLNQLVSRVERLESNIDGLAEDLKGRMAAIEKKAPSPKPAAKVAPKSPKPTAKKSGGSVYTVRPGDTLYSIGRRFGITVDELRKLNNLSSKAVLQLGQKLKIKK